MVTATGVEAATPLRSTRDLQELDFGDEQLGIDQGTISIAD